MVNLSSIFFKSFFVCLFYQEYLTQWCLHELLMVRSKSYPYVCTYRSPWCPRAAGEYRLYHGWHWCALLRTPHGKNWPRQLDHLKYLPYVCFLKRCVAYTFMPQSMCRGQKTTCKLNCLFLPWFPGQRLNSGQQTWCQITFSWWLMWAIAFLPSHTLVVIVVVVVARGIKTSPCPFVI